MLLDQLSYETTDGSWSFVSSNVPVLNESMKKIICMKQIMYIKMHIQNQAKL